MKHRSLHQRSYSVITPHGSGPWPVVMMLHGAGGTAIWTARETRWGEHAHTQGFLLVLPEATRRDLHRPPSFLHNPPVWNDGLIEGQPPRPDVDDVTFLLDVLDDLGSHYPIERNRVYLTGFSNGAAMTFRLASEAAERFAAIAPVAGYCHITPKPVRPIPTLYMIGHLDPLVPIDGGEVVTPWSRQGIHRGSVTETLQAWATAMNCAPSSQLLHQSEYLSIEEYRGPVPFLSYTIHDLGHHWPGGRGELKKSIAGPASNRVDACVLIWDFFRSHALD